MGILCYLLFIYIFIYFIYILMTLVTFLVTLVLFLYFYTFSLFPQSWKERDRNKKEPHQLLERKDDRKVKKEARKKKTRKWKTPLTSYC